MKRNISISTMAVLLSACAQTVSTERSAMIEEMATGRFTFAEIPDAIDAARTHVLVTRKLYQDAASRRHTEQTYFDSTVIALASASVSTAFFHGTPDLIGGLGLAAATLGNYRSYYDSEGVGAANLKAKSGLDCVFNESGILKRADPLALVALLDQIEQAIANLNAAQPALTAAKGPSSAADASQQAMDAARTAIDAINGELAAIQDSPAAISRAEQTIVQYVDLKEHHKSVDFAQATQSFSTSIDAATDAAKKISEARTKLDAAQKAVAQEQGRTDDKTVSPAPQAKAPGAVPAQAPAAAPAAPNAPAPAGQAAAPGPAPLAPTAPGGPAPAVQAVAPTQAPATAPAAPGAPAPATQAAAPANAAQPQRVTPAPAAPAPAVQAAAPANAAQPQRVAPAQGAQAAAPQAPAAPTAQAAAPAQVPAAPAQVPAAVVAAPVQNPMITQAERTNVENAALLINLARLAVDAIGPSYAAVNTKISGCASGF